MVTMQDPYGLVIVFCTKDEMREIKKDPSHYLPELGAVQPKDIMYCVSTDTIDLALEKRPAKMYSTSRIRHYEDDPLFGEIASTQNTSPWLEEMVNEKYELGVHSILSPVLDLQ